MSNPSPFTNWNISPTEAVQLQKELREQVKIVPLRESIERSVNEVRLVGGADVSMSMFAKDGFAGFVTLSRNELTGAFDKPVDHAVVKEKIKFPYIPGLLSFREIPMLLLAWKNLQARPEVIIVDGVGIAHPRRLGIATHLGLILGMPTIGCAKSLLTGTYVEPANEPGSISYIYEKFRSSDGAVPEIIGAALRTKKNVKPVFISPGHLITLEESIELVKKCLLRHRVPETTRFAHNMVNKYRIEDEKNT